MKDNKIFLVVILLLGGMLVGFWYVSQNLVQNATFNLGGNSPDELLQNTPNSETYCDFKLSKSIACIDEVVSAEITTYPNGICRIFYSYEGGDWNYYADLTADSSGLVDWTDSATVTGQYRWKALCSDTESICSTNDEFITINDCTPAPTEPLCDDTDGGLVLEVWGSCNSDVTFTSTPDTCDSAISVAEAVCQPDGTCQVIPIICPAGFSCNGGRCLPLP